MAEQRRPRPTELKNARQEGLVRITWNDDHVSEYTYSYLRGWCPCALCQGHGNERRFVASVDAKVASVEVVGSYAFNFKWADGHDTGIYAYAYLREMCPCATCRP